MNAPDYSVVIPTIGRPSLARLLEALAAGGGPAPREVVVVDDRRAGPALDVGVPGLSLRVLRTGGRGPAAARNAGWREVISPWVAFLDDDVIPEPDWRAALVEDLSSLPGEIAGSQGRLRVPFPDTRAPTDWERNVAGLERALWATADLAYRRPVLEEVGGFDERFLRAFREDSDLGLRIAEAGYIIVRGQRRSLHPVGPAGPWVSVRLQAGNADDALMRARHGAGWRVAAGAEPGRNGRHALTVVAGAAALAGLATGVRRLAAPAAAAWVAATGRFAWTRIAPGPRDPREVLTMAATSAAIPPAAMGHLARGWLRVPAARRDVGRAPLGQARSPLALQPARVLARAGRRPRSGRTDIGWQPAAILFDRDGTLVVDLPGNTDPSRLCLMPGARTAVRRARSAALAVGVVTNQAAIGRGAVTAAEVAAVNRRVDEMIGPFGTWQTCPHVPEAGCDCRKPGPGLVRAAAAALGVDVGRCVVIGDIGSDIGAARAAGARGILVPTPRTRAAEIASAPVVAANLLGAVDLAIASMC